MDRQIIDYYPEWLQDFREIKILSNIHQKQADDLENALEKLWNNLMLDDLDEDGCKRWETMLKIQCKDTFNLEERRQQIKSKFVEQRPFTMNFLINMVDTLCAGAKHTVTLDGYNLDIKIAWTSANMIDTLRTQLVNIIPANIRWNVDVLFNTHNYLSQFPNWVLHQFTHLELREIAIEENIGNTIADIKKYTIAETKQFTIAQIKSFGLRKRG